jgi:hypothetical protein
MGGTLRCLDPGQRSVSPLGNLLASSRNLFGAFPMMDVVMVALALGFFAVSIAYVYACEQL